MKTKNTIDAFHAFQIQSNLLTLHLQLAEGDNKPKRSGDFESTYKSKSGAEITVERSSDGKFASKAGSGAASTSSESKKQATSEGGDTTSGNATEIVRNLLKGDLGKQLKKSIIDSIEKNSVAKDIGTKVGNALNELNIKTGVQQAQFSEILGQGKDAIGNARKYIKSKFDEMSRGASDSETCKNIGKVLVAGLVVSAVAGVAVAAMGEVGQLLLGLR